MKIIVCMKEVVHPLHIGARMIVAETPELECQGFKTNDEFFWRNGCRGCVTDRF